MQQVVQRGSTNVQIPGGAYAPATFWEWFASVYPPDKFIYNWQYYFTTIRALGGAPGNGNLNIQVPLFVMGFRSQFWNVVTGAVPPFPIRIGIALLSGNDWTFGQWSQAVITGAGLGQPYDVYPWPREVPASTQLSITISNTLNPAISIEGDCGVVGLEPRRRDQPIIRGNTGQMATGQRVQ